ncbi:hypothetical protein DPMN_177681 [Dreissena polymorpha]|uniref:Uncharacterized protein n=1 Tax=Dreissena polymorpha TaxID=45954 RepID=A0A9D4ECM7_DREPO|nr:hypothetical protein DPMN_177681 [Dreissena polymorpha]
MPCVMETTIDSIARCLPSKFIKIGADGKKIARGKGKLMGDIDCWDFEQEPTLTKRVARNTDENAIVSEVFTLVKKIDEKGYD